MFIREITDLKKNKNKSLLIKIGLRENFGLVFGSLPG